MIPRCSRGCSPPLLLLLLDRRTDYGYSVVTRLHEAGFDELGEATVYPALTRLEKAGLLSSELRPSTSGPARKYYTTTPAGRAEHVRLIGAWRQLATAVETVIQEEK
ncbi:PadR family transcriptional regulator [Luteococcus sediminum]